MFIIHPLHTFIKLLQHLYDTSTLQTVPLLHLTLLLQIALGEICITEDALLLSARGVAAIASGFTRVTSQALLFDVNFSILYSSSCVTLRQHVISPSRLTDSLT